jgi:hypothetical protein
MILSRGATVLFVILFGVVTFPLRAQQLSNQLLSLNTEKIRIGDSTADPKPVGLSWPHHFDVTAMPKWASLSVEVSDSSYDNPVLLNGTALGFLKPVLAGQWAATIFNLTPDKLKTGDNLLEIQSAAKSKNYDDLYIRAVTLTLGFTDPPVMETLSKTKSLPGGTVLITGERFDPEGGKITLSELEVPSLFASPTQALFRLPRTLTAGNYAVKVKSNGTESPPLELDVIEGEPAYDDLLLGGGAFTMLAGDVAPKPGTGGRPFGDGKLTIADALRVLRRVIGLEPDPWP